MKQAAHAMRFRDYVDLLKISQTEAARRAGVSVAAVHRAYHGLPIAYGNVRRLVVWCAGSVSYDDFAAPERGGRGRAKRDRRHRATMRGAAS